MIPARLNVLWNIGNIFDVFCFCLNNFESQEGDQMSSKGSETKQILNSVTIKCNITLINRSITSASNGI